MTLSFTVYGVAAPAGSKTSGQRKDGSRFVRDSSRRAAPWKHDVANAAAVAAGEAEHRVSFGVLLDGPLALYVRFVIPRPKGHYGVRGLRPSAPAHPTTRPDITKLLRAVEDALTGIVWRDDAQVVEQRASKVYGEPARCEIAISPIPTGGDNRVDN